MRAVEPRDFELSGCSTWTAPNGAVFLELAHTLVFPVVVPANTTMAAQQQPTDAHFVFVLRQISVYEPPPSGGGSPALLYGRFQWPNGHFLSQQAEDLTDFYGIGQYARWVGDLELAPASVIRITDLQNTTGTDQVLYIFFEGILRIPLVPCGSLPRCD